MSDPPSAHSLNCDARADAGATDAVPPMVLDHLERLTGPYGVYEHARFDQPRVTHGYTTDDNARVLVVLADLEDGNRSVTFRRALDFVLSGRVPSGWHNRMSSEGSWMDDLGSDDCHGQALWGLGAVIGSGVAEDRVATSFVTGLDFRSQYLRSTSFAALGVVRARPHLPTEVDRFLDRLSDRYTFPPRKGWRWPEPRLTYANARIPQAMIEVGSLTGSSRMLTDGLELLEWLTDVERRGGHFSFTPVGGRGPDEIGPSFDQQPIEAWAMADACRSALDVDGSEEWRTVGTMAADWFLGLNDNGSILYDAQTGAGFDGLESAGRNQNRGCESTLSALGALAARSHFSELRGGSSRSGEASCPVAVGPRKSRTASANEPAPRETP
ncbi:MAG: glycosyltransferase [Acidimicrobiia bacterium]